MKWTARHRAQELVVPVKAPRPEPVLKLDRRDVAEEERLLGVELRGVVGMRVQRVGDSARLLVQHDQHHEGDEIEQKPAAAAEDERGGEQHEHVAVGREREPEREHLGQEGDPERRAGEGGGAARRSPCVAGPSGRRRPRRDPGRRAPRPVLRHAAHRRRGRLRRGRAARGATAPPSTATRGSIARRASSSCFGRSFMSTAARPRRCGRWRRSWRREWQR